MPPLFDKERVTFDLLVELPVIDFDNIHLHDVIYFSIDNYNPTCCIDHFDTCFFCSLWVWVLFYVTFET